MKDRNNIPLKVGDTIYIPMPVKIVDGYPVQDCWIAVVEDIRVEKGKEILYAKDRDTTKTFKLKQDDFYEENKNICKALTPEDDPIMFRR